MKKLPAALLDRTPVEKLVWLHIRANPGEWSAATLGEALGVNAVRALSALLAAGLLVEERAPAGRRAGVYRAATSAAPER